VFGNVGKGNTFDMVVSVSFALSSLLSSRSRKSTQVRAKILVIIVSPGFRHSNGRVKYMNLKLHTYQAYRYVQ